MEKFNEVAKKYKLVFLGAGLFSLVIICLFILASLFIKKAPDVQKTTQEIDTNTSVSTRDVTSIAKTNFKSFTYSSQLPQLPSSMTIYKLKTNYTLEEAKTFAQKLDLQTYKERNMDMFFYNNQTEASKGWLLFNKQTGSFTYQAYKADTTSGSTVSPSDTAYQFLTKMGIADPTVTCPITYQKKGMDNVIFVECHRDWQRTGAPILNMLGLMNINENERISQLKPGYVDTDAPIDLSIIKTSTNQDGKKRPDDFNTATVAVRPDGTIVMAKSNIRQISTSVPIKSQTDMITPTNAWEKIQSNRAEVSIVLPSGSGVTDWKRVFPGDIASSSQAKITDYVLVYVENSTNQEYLTPMYLIRGTAHTDSGYDIKFIQAVPATKLQLSSATGMTQDVAGSSTYLAQGLQMETFYITPTAGIGSDAEITEPSNRSVTNGSETCIPTSQQLSPLSQLTGVGTIGPWSIPPFHDADGQRSYYLLPSGNQSWPEVETIIASFGQLGFERTTGITQDREVSDFSKDIIEASFSNCPVRISGSSPTIFMYGPEGSAYTLTVQRALTFSDPAPHGRSWNVQMHNNMLKVNGLLRQYVYYEYAPLVFNRPQRGWVIQKKELDALATQTIAPTLELTPMETERLTFELHHAAYNFDDSTLFVGVIPQQEIDRTLPLTISPQTAKVIRYHFYIGKAEGGSEPTVPDLSPIQRPESYLLELGAAPGEYANDFLVSESILYIL